MVSQTASAISHNQNEVNLLKQLTILLGSNLDFHQENGAHPLHSIHAFPAKFPPQLPQAFINGLTEPGDIVLDPMAGSGTTILEALLAGRDAVGFDIDPLAIMLSRAKVTSFHRAQLEELGSEIVARARYTVLSDNGLLRQELNKFFDLKTLEFIQYWFARPTQLELFALKKEIERVEDNSARLFMELTFSGIIITKSGGVSLAFDLAHTRPHRAKVVKTQTGEVILGEELAHSNVRRVQILTKVLRSPLDEFEKRLKRNLASLEGFSGSTSAAYLGPGDAQRLPLSGASIDLIVTSPPYISNAIDYMRAHKFTLVWWRYPVDALSEKRKGYIGGEALDSVQLETLPDDTARLVARIAAINAKKGRVVHRYYSEMTRVLNEMYRVLKPGKCAVLVVGTSIIQGQDTHIDACLADIGRSIGFEVPPPGIRRLDRDRRMLPASAKPDRESQIQQRMHEEYVIGLYKPED